MSKHDHPAFPDCCTPWARTKPSGRIEYVHRFNCSVAPNKVLERKPLPARAELASHAARRNDVDPDEYEMAWRDLAFELEGGR